MRPRHNFALILGAAFSRSLSIGFLGVVLGIYLARRGFSAAAIGAVLAAGLAGSALATLAVSLYADHVGRKRFLVALSALAALGGIGLPLTSHLAGVLFVAFFGTLNGLGTDRGPLFALEQAVLPQIAPGTPTVGFAWYNVVLDAGHALGALAGSLPLLLSKWSSLDINSAYRIAFLGYATLNLLSALLYISLTDSVELLHGRPDIRRPPMTLQTKKTLARLTGLFSLDSFGGGLIADAMLAYWFFVRFGASEAALGPLFFATHALNSASYPVAAWLAQRVGLLNTMVFTHLPSSLFLAGVAVAPSFPWAVGLLLARESLASMDVPARQAYVTAIVTPQERTFASGVTNLTRNLVRAIAPSLAGFLMQNLSVAAPIFAGSGAKISYDLLLYAGFRKSRLESEETEKDPARTAFLKTEK